MKNEHDVMNDIIERLHGTYGCIMGTMDNDENTIDVRTVDDDIVTITIAIKSATENVVDEQCERGQCERRATYICDTCGAMLCNEHTFIGNTVVIDGMNIPYTYCPTVWCVHGIQRGA